MLLYTYLYDDLLHQLDIENTICHFIDLSRAFDTIDHSTLLHTIKYYGIDNLACTFVKAILVIIVKK